jgi:thioredoxin reductase
MSRPSSALIESGSEKGLFDGLPRDSDRRWTRRIGSRHAFGASKISRVAAGKAVVRRWVMNIEWAMNYPVKGQKMAGHALASELIDRCRESGVRMQQGEVVEVESSSRVKSVTCGDGKTYSSAALILAGGMRAKPMG